jgi:hypothetical protein
MMISAAMSSSSAVAGQRVISFIGQPVSERER